MLSLNTWASHILWIVLLFLPSPLFLPFLSSWSHENTRISGTILALSYLFPFVFSSSLTSLFVFLERRHLMVWRVFAPKLVFEFATLIVVDVMLILS